MKPGDVAHYLMHQANLRILEDIRTRLGVEAEKLPHTIDRTGNTSSASCATTAGRAKPARATCTRAM